jgi:hypothetical protein
MKYKTKKALILLMIAQLFAIATSIFMFLYLHSTDIQSILSGFNQTILTTILTSGLISSIGGTILLIGAVLFFLGRKECNEKHQKFVFYALIVFIIILLITLTNFTVSIPSSLLSSTESTEVVNDVAYIADFLINTLSTTAIISALLAILTGFVWVLALYHLENKKGKIIVLFAFITMIFFSLGSSFLSLSLFNNFIDSESFTISVASANDFQGYIYYLSVYEYIGSLGIINLIGTILVSSLLLMALYIAYKRIQSDDIDYS